MQTIKVNTKTDNISTVFEVNGKQIAETWKQNGTQYSDVLRDMHPHGCRQDIHTTFADAIEFIGDCICNHFAKFGLNVEFV